MPITRNRTRRALTFRGHAVTGMRYSGGGFSYADDWSFYDVQSTTDDIHTDHESVKILSRILSSPRAVSGLDPNFRERYEELVNTSDVGGRFLSLRSSTFVNAPNVAISADLGGVTAYRDGPLIPNMQGLENPSVPVPPDPTELFGLGGQAISRVRPLKSKAQLGVALGELREDGLPKARSSLLKLRSLRGGAQDLLSAEFGWRPLISDISNAISAFEQCDRLWSQIERDAGRQIRRRYQFPVVETVSSTRFDNGSAYAYPLSPGYTYLWTGWGDDNVAVRYDRSRTKVWFSGAFRYALPSVSARWSAYRREARKFRDVYGLTVDPQVVFNLAPYTWLLDWFVDLQPMFSWISTAFADDLVMRYGYIMRSQETHHSWGATYSTTSGVFQSAAEVIVSTKERYQASPYGFGLTNAPLTGEQQAILGALGITRAHHLLG